MQPEDALNEDALNAALDEEIARALAVDPAPEFVARVRTQIAREPARSRWNMSWIVGVSAVAAVVIAAIVVQRINHDRSAIDAPTLLSARSIAPFTGALAMSGPAEAGRQVRSDATNPAAGTAPMNTYVVSEGQVLLDPRESMALRALIRGVRQGDLDLAPVLRASTTTAMDLAPIDDIVIPEISIEPLAPIGAEGVRQ